MKVKRSLFMAVLFLLIVCFSGSLAFAEDPTNAPKVFDQALMNSLLNQGYEWNDLIQASILAHHYKVPLQSILDLRPAGTTWEQIEVALVEMDYARTMLRDKTKLKEDHVIAWLVKKGFTDEEIALLAYNAALSDEPLTRAAGKAMQELDQRGGKREKRIDFGFTTSAETMTLSSTLTSTVTYDDPGLGYDVQKCSPFNRLMQSRNEVINPASGSLQITETDLVLPGRNGLDFSLTRIYQSEKSEMNKTGALYEIGNTVRQAYTATVYCWDEVAEHQITVTVPAGSSVNGNNTVSLNVPAHTYGGVRHSGFIASVPAKNNLNVTANTHGDNYLDKRYHLGTGWGWALPSIETGYTKSYLHTGTGATYQLVEDESGYDLVGVEHNEYTFSYYTQGNVTDARYVLKHKSGVNYYFNASRCLILIRNQFGNSITLKWGLMNNSYILTEVVDTVGRVIKFDYSLPTEVKVTIGTGAGAMVIRYIKALELYQYKLVQAILPEGITTSYTYLRKDEDLGVQEDPEGMPLGVNVKSYLLLASFTNPYKGTTTYNYSTHSRRLGYNDYEKYYKLSSRYDMANGKKMNNVVYTYQNHDKYPYPMDPTLDYTYVYTSTIDYGNRTEVYTYDGIKHLNTSVETTLTGKPAYKETKTISYIGNLPHITSVKKEDTSFQQEQVFNTTTEYDSYGNLIFSQDSVGHITESSYLTKSRADTETSFQVVDWTRERVNPDATGNMMYVGSDYEYDGYGNVNYEETKEWYTTWNTVTENLGSQRLTSTGAYYQKLFVKPHFN